MHIDQPHTWCQPTESVSHKQTHKSLHFHKPFTHTHTLTIARTQMHRAGTHSAVRVRRTEPNPAPSRIYMHQRSLLARKGSTAVTLYTYVLCVKCVQLMLLFWLLLLLLLLLDLPGGPNNSNGKHGSHLSRHQIWQAYSCYVSSVLSCLSQCGPKCWKYLSLG